MLSILEDGNVITNKRVISYETIDDGLWMASARVGEITEVTVIEQGGMLSDTVLLIQTVDGDAFYVLASTEENGDDRFLDELRQMIRDDGD